jgi:hypothetical protein
VIELWRWPNGECRVVDTQTLVASQWLRFAPQGSLSSVPLEYDCSEGPRSSDIASDASYAEANSWLPSGFEILDIEGIGLAARRRVGIGRAIGKGV